MFSQFRILATMFVDLKLVVVLLAVLAVVSCANNATTTAATAAAGASTTAAPPTATRRPGVLTSLGKSLIDIPLGLFEACKDGAQAFETLLTGIFGK